MVCLYCAGETRVVNSRSHNRQTAVWRRRRCNNCGAIITTEETPRYETALMVQTASDALEPFSRDILFMSLYTSLAHRKTAIEDAAALTRTVIGALQAHHQAAAIIAVSDLRDRIMACLELFDKPAWSHYQAYHP